MEWLIKNGFLKLNRGRYPNLIVCNKQRGKAHKNRYVSDPVAFHLNKMNDYKVNS